MQNESCIKRVETLETAIRYNKKTLGLSVVPEKVTGFLVQITDEIQC